MAEALLKTGDRVALALDSLAVGGEAVARHEGMAVFSMWGCPGDVAEVEITETRRSFARGVVRAVVSPSPDRVPAPCPHFGDCGGCQLQHITYEAQIRHKCAMVRDALARVGGLPDVPVAECRGMEQPWRYRNRAEYHAQVSETGRFMLGFSRHRSHEIIGLRQCNLQHPFSEQVRQAVVELMPRVAQGAVEQASLLGMETLVSYRAGRGIATLICEGRPAFVPSLADALRQEVPELAGVLVARRRGRAAHRSPAEIVWGAGHIVEEIAGGEYGVSADSFFQANPAQAARVVQLVREWAEVKAADTVMDLYSGAGTFVLPLARLARRAVAVEESESAVADARANARRWRLGKIKFHERRVERLLAKLVEHGETAEVVVLDPPRTGCGPIVAALTAKLQPRRIILVSCHPATLARDLRSFADHGYPCRRVQPVDMFPQTWHVEAVALCDRAA